jgi:uncharacterized membrane protein YcaP (DUF421 family)
MRTFNSMSALARAALEHNCLICNVMHQDTNDLKPARLTMLTPGDKREVIQAGMVCKKAKAGKRHTNGWLIKSVKRKGIKLVVKFNRRNVPFYIEDVG